MAHGLRHNNGTRVKAQLWYTGYGTIYDARVTGQFMAHGLRHNLWYTGKGTIMVHGLRHNL